MSGATPARVLIVDDETTFADAMATRLRDEGHDCRVAGTLDEARTFLAEGSDWTPMLILLDMRLPDGTGLDLLAEQADRESGPATVVITAFGDIDNAIEAMKRGAVDYLRKPLDLEELAIVVGRVLATRDLETRLAYARERDTRSVERASLLGRSPAMAAIRREIEAVAAVTAETGAPPNVLITGETGTGKDIAARLIHLGGERADEPFVRIDCTTLAPQTIEAELFGRGGTDAAVGPIETAENGTLLLDEIAELPTALQARLLSVIEGRRLRRTGSRSETPIRARFIATTNRDPHDMIAAGALRADLYYRLNVLGLHMPSLRDCEDDAVLLARHFAAATARRYGRPAPILTDGAEAAIARYRWPGNVRELAHLIERAVLLDRNSGIGARDLPLVADAVPDDKASSGDDGLEGISLGAAERRLMVAALERARGNVSAAARALGITRMAMRYRMQKHGL